MHVPCRDSSASKIQHATLNMDHGKVVTPTRPGSRPIFPFEWPNGAVCVFFSGEEPESLRGPQCELCVIDEIARMRAANLVTVVQAC